MVIYRGCLRLEVQICLHKKICCHPLFGHCEAVKLHSCVNVVAFMSRLLLCKINIALVKSLHTILFTSYHYQIINEMFFYLVQDIVPVDASYEVKELYVQENKLDLAKADAETLPAIQIGKVIFKDNHS